MYNTLFYSSYSHRIQFFLNNLHYRISTHLNLNWQKTLPILNTHFHKHTITDPLSYPALQVLQLVVLKDRRPADIASRPRPRPIPPKFTRASFSHSRRTCFEISNCPNPILFLLYSIDNIHQADAHRRTIKPSRVE